MDPREFLVEVEATQVDRTLRLADHYFACNDKEGRCIPMTQRYRIQLERDPAGGNHPARSSHGAPEVNRH